MHLSSRSLKAGSRCQERRLFLFFLLKATSWAKWTFQPDRGSHPSNSQGLGAFEGWGKQMHLPQAVQSALITDRFKPQSLQDLNPLWRLRALHWNVQSLFITPFLGSHKQTRSTAQSTQSSALLQHSAGNRRFSTSCSRQKAECGQSVTAEAGRPSCMRHAERPKKGRDEQAGWQQMRWQTQTRSRPSRPVKDQHYPFFHSILLNLQNTTR